MPGTRYDVAQQSVPLVALEAKVCDSVRLNESAFSRSSTANLRFLEKNRAKAARVSSLKGRWALFARNTRRRIPFGDKRMKSPKFRHKVSEEFGRLSVPTIAALSRNAE